MLGFSTHDFAASKDSAAHMVLKENITVRVFSLARILLGWSDRNSRVEDCVTGKKNIHTLFLFHCF